MQRRDQVKRPNNIIKGYKETKDKLNITILFNAEKRRSNEAKII